MNVQQLNRTLDARAFAKRMGEYWTQFMADEFNIQPIPLKTNLSLLDKLSVGKHKLYVVFDCAQFKLLYVGKNAELVTGYSSKEFAKEGLPLLLKMMVPSQLPFLVKLLDWIKIVKTQFVPEFFSKDGYQIFCGIQFKTKSGTLINTLMRTIGLDKNEKGQCVNLVIEISEITSLMKSDKYWALFSMGGEGDSQHEITFFSDQENKKNTHFLISTREMEILKLIANGLSSKEIGKKLFISYETVDKHRKNMVARVGARDTMALVEICRRSGII
jgi:DNA-binding CsgD family transcriptional regulator